MTRTPRALLGVALLVSLGATLLAVEEVRFRAARDRTDTRFHGVWDAAWEGRDVYQPPAGLHRVPIALSGPRPPRQDAGSTLVLPFTADPGYRIAVRIVQFENNASEPPLLAVSLDGGPPAVVATLRGEGRPMVNIETGSGATYAVTPPGRSRCGPNWVTLRAEAGSWMGISRVEIAVQRRVPAVLARWTAIAAAALWLLLAAAALRRWWRRTPPERRAGQAAGRLALVAASAAAALLASELVLRWLEPRSARVRNMLYIAGESPTAPRGADFLEWLQGHRCSPAPCSLAEDGFRVNRHGFHTRPYRVAAAPGVSRLLGIGDSFMFTGGPVPYADQFFVRVEETLRAASPDRQWEAINLGMSCIGIPTEVAILRHEGLRLRPDLVVWTIYLGNDLTDERAGIPAEFAEPAAVARRAGEEPVAPAGSDASTAQPSATPTPHPLPTSPLLLHGLTFRLASHLVQLARYEPAALVAPCAKPSPAPAASAECGALDPAVALPPYDPLRPTMSDESYLQYARGRLQLVFNADNRAATEESIALLLRRMEAALPLVAGRRVLVVVIPDELQVSAAARQRVIAADPDLQRLPLELELPHRGVVDGLERLGFAVLDLQPRFAADSAAGALLYHRNDSHLSRLGNHLTADLIAQELQRRGWLGPQAAER